MIHGSTSDPVLIKKIALKVWLLRDEIEAVIQERIVNLKDGETPPSIEDLIQEYKENGSFNNGAAAANGKIAAAEDLDDSGEAEMLAAMQGDGEGDESTDEGESAETNDAQVVELEIAPITDSDGSTVIRQRSPLLSDDKIFNGTTILAEVNMDEIFFFSTQEFLVGQSIVMEFLIPKRFIINATILFCRTFNMKSRIISKNRTPFRVGAKFSFLKEGERTLLRQFVQSIEPDVPDEPVAKQQSSGGSDDVDDDDDLFDSLDDMEL